MAGTTRKSKSSKPPAVKRLTDEELATLIKQFVAKLPNATMQAVTKEIRAAWVSRSAVAGSATCGRARPSARRRQQQPKRRSRVGALARPRSVSADEHARRLWRLFARPAREDPPGRT